jgi:DNA-binding LacI/PurR family transcriptional regulator
LLFRAFHLRIVFSFPAVWRQRDGECLIERTGNLDNTSPVSKPKEKKEDFLYLKLVKDIKNAILTGAYPPDSQLPSSNKLAEQHQMHRLTVRRALEELKRERLVYAIPAKGVYVGEGKTAPSTRSRRAPGAQWSIGIINDIVQPSLFGYFHFEIIEQIRNLIQQDLHSLQILPPRGDNSLSDWIKAIRKFELTGLILIGPMDPTVVAELGSMKPVVHLDPQAPSPAFTSINIGNEHGGLLAARHLLELGHTDIAVVTAVDQLCSNQRLEGFMQAVKEAANPHIRVRTYEGNFSSESGLRAAEKILAEDRLPTAVFCFNDEMALGVLQTFSAASVSVPNDVSLVGFDDVAVTMAAVPPLTTIRVSTPDIAWLAVDALRHKLSGRQTNEIQNIVLPKLMVRASTAPPRA